MSPVLRHWGGGLACFLLTVGLAFGLRMLEWPSWQNPEYRLGGEMLLATHDAYHWVAGAEGFGLAVDHPMARMLRLMADASGLAPAVVAFWFPPALASLVAGIVFLWAWALGSMQAGVAAGLVASMAPGFLGRTLLGYYDTDLVTLFFPLLMTLAPACWAMRYMLLPQMVLRRLRAPAGLAALPGALLPARLRRRRAAPAGGAPLLREAPRPG
ncbi:STT3 domain-containing protein, partial [uncultured Desulfovibrio sp.]